MKVPSVSIVVAVEEAPRLSLEVGVNDWPTVLDWLRQPQTRAAILQLADLVTGEVVP